MAQLKIKKSNETGKTPQPGDLDWGELAINYTDGKLFYKQHGTGLVQQLNTDTNTVTRLRGTAGGSYTAGDLTLLAGTNITITQNGSDYTIASAGGVDSTKLPLTGGTLTGQLSITDTTQSTSIGTGALIVSGGVGVAKNLYVGNSIYTTRAIEMSTSNNGLYHASNNMSFDSPAADTFRIVNGRGAGAFSATLLFKSGYTGNNYGAVIGGGTGEVRLATNRGDAFVSSPTSTSIFDEVGGTRIVVSTGNQVQIYNNLTLMNTGSLVAGGTVQHTGLVMTAGTNVDQIYTHQQSITLTTSWQDTGVNAAELATGSYMVQVTNVEDFTVGGQQYQEYYTGVMSWFSGNTNSAATDEIVLHRAGHAPNGGTIFLRVLRTLGADTDDLKLQIAGTTNNTAAYQYTFKFRRLI